MMTPRGAQNLETIEKCRTKLIETKSELLNRSRDLMREFRDIERSSGDEIDLTVANLVEHQYLVSNERIRNQLLEIEQALSRIDQDIYGICEETREPIEAQRLLAIPWTRLSIEGAEIRQSLLKRYSKI